MSSTRAGTSGTRRLVLFDIDGTLLSAGRAAREAVLAALGSVYGWTPNGDQGSRHDFSGKTDPQIMRELVAGAVGTQRCEEELERALAAYLAEFERRLDPRAIVAKPGVAALLERLSREEEVVLGLLTGNLERGARLKLEPLGFNRYFPFGAFGSDSHDRYRLPPIAVERARALTNRDFRGKAIVVIGDSVHDIACGRSLGVRSIAVATGPTTADRLLSEKPDAFFEDFSDVDHALEEILA
jgi:phosphoglycolate phosphatase